MKEGTATIFIHKKQNGVGNRHAQQMDTIMDAEIPARTGLAIPESRARSSLGLGNKGKFVEIMDGQLGSPLNERALEKARQHEYKSLFINIIKLAPAPISPAGFPLAKPYLVRHR